MPVNDPPRPILSEAEVTRRMALLADLQDALAARGVRAVLARRRRLVLRANQIITPSGPTDPELHIFAPGGADVAITDGSSYQLASGREYPAADPADAATAAISRGLPAASLTAGIPAQSPLSTRTAARHACAGPVRP